MVAHSLVHSRDESTLPHIERVLVRLGRHNKVQHSFHVNRTASREARVPARSFRAAHEGLRVRVEDAINDFGDDASADPAELSQRPRAVEQIVLGKNAAPSAGHSIENGRLRFGQNMEPERRVLLKAGIDGRPLERLRRGIGIVVRPLVRFYPDDKSVNGKRPLTLSVCLELLGHGLAVQELVGVTAQQIQQREGRTVRIRQLVVYERLRFACCARAGHARRQHGERIDQRRVELISELEPNVRVGVSSAAVLSVSMTSSPNTLPVRNYLIDDPLIAERIFKCEGQICLLSQHRCGKVLHHQLILVNVAKFHGVCLTCFIGTMANVCRTVDSRIEGGIYTQPSFCSVKNHVLAARHLCAAVERH